MLNTLEALLMQKQQAVLDDWKADLARRARGRSGVDRLRADTDSILGLLTRAAKDDVLLDRDSEAWRELGTELDIVARSCQEQGLDWEDVATVMSALRAVLTSMILEQGEAHAHASMLHRANAVLDLMGLQASESYLQARDRIIERQQLEVLELSVPVSMLWPHVLVLPLIGSLDSHRAHVVLETLLTRIDELSAKVVLIDITGVATVDTAVAQNIIKTITAARLMGTECIITGIRPQIAQTIVHLGINLKEFETRATLAEGLQKALEMTGSRIQRIDP